MSDKITVSHNRADYSPRVQMMISAMAKVFWNGDLDAAWGHYFETRDREAPANAEAERQAIGGNAGRISPANHQAGEGLVRLPIPL